MTLNGTAMPTMAITSPMIKMAQPRSHRSSSANTHHHENAYHLYAWQIADELSASSRMCATMTAPTFEAPCSLEGVSLGGRRPCADRIRGGMSMLKQVTISTSLPWVQGETCTAALRTQGVCPFVATGASNDRASDDNNEPNQGQGDERGI